MKKLIVFIFFSISLNLFSQKFNVTPDGLRSNSDLEKKYLVIECKGKSSTQLYDDMIKYINKEYKNPDKVIKGKSEGEYLKFDTYNPNMFTYNNSGVKVPISANYTTELSFKDGKVKFEIISLLMKSNKYNMSVLFSGGMLAGYIIYKKNGKLFKEAAKNDIESYFNSYVSSLSSYLNGGGNDDW